MNNIILDLEIDINEFCRVCIVGMYASDFCRREEHIFRLFALEEFLHGCLVCQVELSMRARDYALEALFLKSPHQCRTDKAAVSGDVDFLFRVQCSGLKVQSSKFKVEG